jgi:hypothetical protein
VDGPPTLAPAIVPLVDTVNGRLLPNVIADAVVVGDVDGGDILIGRAAPNVNATGAAWIAGRATPNATVPLDDVVVVVVVVANDLAGAIMDAAAGEVGKDCTTGGIAAIGVTGDAGFASVAVVIIVIAIGATIIPLLPLVATVDLDGDIRVVIGAAKKELVGGPIGFALMGSPPNGFVG